MSGMRITLDCMTCLKSPDPETIRWPLQRVMANLEEKGVYERICEQGHVTVYGLQNFRFQLLFDLGLGAILDGYYREAVSAFASALERFHETYLRIVATANGTPAEVFATSWKHMKKQSERQLGAFIQTYTMKEKELPPLLDPSKDIPFRNDVIHAGKFPTRDEVMTFGQTVYDIMYKVIRRLRPSHDEAVTAVFERLRNEIRVHVGGDRTFHWMTQVPFVELLGELRESPQDVRAWVEAFSKLDEAGGAPRRGYSAPGA
jgi:hypothetical protein